jgi:hypothetical protein
MEKELNWKEAAEQAMEFIGRGRILMMKQSKNNGLLSKSLSGRNLPFRVGCIYRHDGMGS